MDVKLYHEIHLYYWYQVKEYYVHFWYTIKHLIYTIQLSKAEVSKAKSS